eukprot:UN10138
MCYQFYNVIHIMFTVISDNIKRTRKRTEDGERFFLLI